MGGRFLDSDMLESFTLTCEAADCDQRLAETDRRLVYESPGGTRHLYECRCGAVTITVAR